MGIPNTTASTFVALVVDKPETVDELQAYLGRAGLVAPRARVDAEPRGVAAAATAAGWSADDLAAVTVIAAIGQLQAAAPSPQDSPHHERAADVRGTIRRGRDGPERAPEASRRAKEPRRAQSAIPARASHDIEPPAW